MAWRRHQEKMKGMRCRVETGRRQEMQAIAMVSKKDTLRDMRMEAIDRENSILLGKISAISYKSTLSNPLSPITQTLTTPPHKTNPALTIPQTLEIENHRLKLLTLSPAHK
jgi:hypothetical protein